MVIKKTSSLQAIGSKVEILALTDVEYVVYWFNELPLLCEDRYKEMMEQAEAPLTYTPLIMSERLYHLVTSMSEFLAEENPCSKYIDLKCKTICLSRNVIPGCSSLLISNSPFIIKSIQFCVHLSLGICSPLGKFLYTRIFSTFFGHPVQLVYCMQNESPGMSFMRDLLS